RRDRGSAAGRVAASGTVEDTAPGGGAIRAGAGACVMSDLLWRHEEGTFPSCLAKLRRVG
ncbi:hypothetical protein DZF93_05940, partial [Clavibacter michiganensis subsp. insidiosus]